MSKLTSIMLSEEDRALIRKLAPIVRAKIGTDTMASVIRYALRRTAEYERKRKRP